MRDKSEYHIDIFLIHTGLLCSLRVNTERLKIDRVLNVLVTFDAHCSAFTFLTAGNAGKSLCTQVDRSETLSGANCDDTAAKTIAATSFRIPFHDGVTEDPGIPVL